MGDFHKIFLKNIQTSSLCVWNGLKSTEFLQLILDVLTKVKCFALKDN